MPRVPAVRWWVGDSVGDSVGGSLGVPWVLSVGDAVSSLVYDGL